MMDCATTSQPGHTNHLVHATSPYLLQHAHNPVDWYPWGPEALDKSRRESKLIFLSIGYAACHWCHVMERESFEDAEIAQILNDSFVAIKVDREERPDLDEVYMSATMLANQGQGGWPMSVFLTPDQRPFFAGTYFPPHSAYGRPGFRDLLLEIARMWREEPAKVAEHSRNLAEGVRQMATPATSDETIPRATITGTVDMLARAFDRQSGGLPGGNGTKFPPSMTMSLMLRECRHGKRTGKAREELLGLVELTLDHMARGGIYDHLGGGISRYSTDSDWLVPHFEKMLYDQALVSAVYFEAFELTGRRRYADVGCNILDYVLADLQSPEGAFYSSRDADSEGVEGKYYVWSKPEVISILGERAGELFCSYYDVTDSGNWEGRNILNVQRDVETVARLNNLSLSELSASLGSSRAKLLQLRSRRVPPGLDDKILTSWNGLIISSLARGARVTGQAKYAEAATKAAEFILAHMSRNGRLLRTSRNGTAHTGGFLDDYAFFTEGLLDLYESTFETRRLDEAIRLTDLTIEHFWDTERGGFFSTANDAEQLIVRSKDSRDGAIPSGNSVALMNLVRLAVMLDRKDLQAKAEATMKAYGSTIRQSPGAFDRFLAAADFYHRPHTEVVLVGSPTHPGTRALLEAIRQVYDPGRVVLLLDPADPVAPARQAAIPLLAGKTLIDGNPAAYVCRNYVCRRPVTSPQALARELQAE